MPLPTVKDAKDYLRLQTSAEDAIVSALLVRAQAIVESFLGLPILALADSMIDDTTQTMRAYQSPTRLQLSRYPITASSVVVTDTNGTVVLASTYRVDVRAGQIIGNPGVSFGAGPYTITGNVGLSAHPDYATKIEAVIAAGIIDVVADLYQHRNPSALEESSGGGISVKYAAADDLPPRTKRMLSPYRLTAVV